jgi:hypothetical protein
MHARTHIEQSYKNLHSSTVGALLCTTQAVCCDQRQSFAPAQQKSFHVGSRPDAPPPFNHTRSYLKMTPTSCREDVINALSADFLF